MRETERYDLNARVVITTGRKGSVVTEELSVVAGGVDQGPVNTKNVDAQMGGAFVVAEYHIGDLDRAYNRVMKQVLHLGRGKIMSSEELGFPKEDQYPKLNLNHLRDGKID